MNKILFLDIETTGFSRQWDFIIELAAVIYDSYRQEIIGTFHEYIKPGKSIPVKITELTGITNAQVSSCRAEKEVLMDFTEWASISKPNQIIGHNCKAFDLSFIREKCNKYQLTLNEDGIEIIDTLTLARQLNKCGKISTIDCKQTTLAEFFGIKYEAHSAIEDVKALIKIFDCMQQLTKPITRESLGF